MVVPWAVLYCRNTHSQKQLDILALMPLWSFIHALACNNKQMAEMSAGKAVGHHA